MYDDSPARFKSWLIARRRCLIFLLRDCKECLGCGLTHDWDWNRSLSKNINSVGIIGVQFSAVLLGELHSKNPACNFIIQTQVYRVRSVNASSVIRPHYFKDIQTTGYAVMARLSRKARLWNFLPLQIVTGLLKMKASDWQQCLETLTLESILQRLPYGSAALMIFLSKLMLSCAAWGVSSFMSTRLAKATLILKQLNTTKSFSHITRK